MMKRYNKFADKYLVRQYVKECGLEDLPIPLFGVFKNPEDINYDTLPDKFILKTTQGSGIDFYVVDHKLYFGEITLTPAAGNHKDLNELGQQELGKTVK